MQRLMRAQRIRNCPVINAAVVLTRKPREIRSSPLRHIP